MVRVHEPPLDNRVVEVLRGGDHPRVVLGNRGDTDTNTIADVEDARWQARISQPT